MRRTDFSALPGVESAAWESAQGPVPDDRDRDETVVTGGAALLPDHVSAPIDGAGGAESGTPLDLVVPEPSDDGRVAVVRPDDADEDFAAWDSAGATVLPWALNSGAADAEEPFTPDYTLRETMPWGWSVNHTAARSTAGVTETVYDEDDELFLPRFHFDDDAQTCGGDEEFEARAAEARQAEEEARAAEEAAAEKEKERTAADLLRQDDTAWAAGAIAAKRPGVIE
ncbi:hypothetical protein [Lentzea sp. NPDC004782]|uniref:hypothetical protein n=1 Tax=Lentzea sp. NPDC004782 TaxID=3154458 RepID=UPI0033B933A4